MPTKKLEKIRFYLERDKYLRVANEWHWLHKKISCEVAGVAQMDNCDSHINSQLSKQKQQPRQRLFSFDSSHSIATLIATKKEIMR
jgi:hypothetical protein